MLIYSETILFPVIIYQFKVNNKNTRKRCKTSPKLTKNPSKGGRLQYVADSDIHSSSFEKSVFSGCDMIGMPNFKSL